MASVKPSSNYGVRVVTGRTWADVGGLDLNLEGSKVWVRGRIITSNLVSSGICVLVLRDEGFRSIRCVVAVSEFVSAKMVRFASNLKVGSLITVGGIVRVPNEHIEGATQQVELEVKAIFCTKAEVTARAVVAIGKSTQLVQPSKKPTDVGRETSSGNKVTLCAYCKSQLNVLFDHYSTIEGTSVAPSGCTCSPGTLIRKERDIERSNKKFEMQEERARRKARELRLEEEANLRVQAWTTCTVTYPILNASFGSDLAGCVWKTLHLNKSSWELKTYGIFVRMMLDRANSGIEPPTRQSVQVSWSDHRGADQTLTRANFRNFKRYGASATVEISAERYQLPFVSRTLSVMLCHALAQKLSLVVLGLRECEKAIRAGKAAFLFLSTTSGAKAAHKLVDLAAMAEKAEVPFVFVKQPIEYKSKSANGVSKDALCRVALVYDCNLAFAGRPSHYMDEAVQRYKDALDDATKFQARCQTIFTRGEKL